MKSVTVTLYNSSNGLTYSRTVNVPVTIDITSKADAWVGIEYSYAIAVPDGTVTYTLNTDVAQSWLTLTQYEDAGQAYVLLSGTPLPALANTTLGVDIPNLEGWTIYIWPHVDDSNVTVGFSSQVNDYTVTLTNNGSKGNGVVMFVDWGTTDLVSGTQRQPGTETATAQYSVAGQYMVIMTLLINGQSYNSSGLITVPSQSASFTLSYNGNGSTGGSMPTQNGTQITVLDNGFTLDGETFVRWNTQPNGSGQNYSPGDTISLTANTTLFVIWSNTDTTTGTDWSNIGLMILIGIIAVILTFGAFYLRMPFLLIPAAVFWIILAYLAWS
jgi:hypothetical protein